MRRAISARITAGLLSFSLASALALAPAQPGFGKSPTRVSPTMINPCAIVSCSYSKSPAIAAPAAFSQVTDSKLCGAHGYAELAVEACAAATRGGELVVAWNWNAAACPAAPACTAAIDGFRVYRLTGKGKYSAVLVTTQYSGARVTLVSFPDPGDTCFVVRAYKGRLESADSNEYCPLERAVAP